MRVKFKRLYAGSLGTWMPGKTGDIPEDQAKVWVGNGWAEYADVTPIELPEEIEEVTVAEEPKEETTENPKPKPKRGKRGRPSTK